MRRDNIILEKSMSFAIRIVRLYQYLTKEKTEYILSKQIMRSGTSIGANIREAVQGQSRNDFTAKMSISLKEAAETEYWLELLYKTDYLSRAQYESLCADCSEISKLLTAILKSTKENRS